MPTPIWTQLSINRIAQGTMEVLAATHDAPHGIVSVQHSDGFVIRRRLEEGEDPRVAARRMLKAHAVEQCSPFWDPIDYPTKGVV
jgi:hypothetical protein